MNRETQQLLHAIETLPPQMQQEVIDFVQVLQSKSGQKIQEEEQNTAKIAQLMEQIAARGTAFRDIQDPAAWQREIRKDRPLPGRE